MTSGWQTPRNPEAPNQTKACVLVGGCSNAIGYIVQHAMEYLIVCGKLPPSLYFLRSSARLCYRPLPAIHWSCAGTNVTRRQLLLLGACIRNYSPCRPNYTDIIFSTVSNALRVVFIHAYRRINFTHAKSKARLYVPSMNVSNMVLFLVPSSQVSEAIRAPTPPVRNYLRVISDLCNYLRVSPGRAIQTDASNGPCT